MQHLTNTAALLNRLYGFYTPLMRKLPILLLILSLLLLSGTLSLWAQTPDPVRVMSYNLLNYPDPTAASADTGARNPMFRTVIQAAQPDLLVVVEMNSSAGYTGFLNLVMNASQVQYAAAPYLASYDSQRGLYYRTSKFQFLSGRAIRTDLRDINEYKLLHILSGDTLRIYALHLKASSGTVNEQQRASEVDSLRKVTNTLPAGSNFIVCGDFNIYSSQEAAYQKLIQVQVGNEGHVKDPLALTGTWNNPAYAIHHTQSPRIRSFGGGATGGLDDRFDMILFSKGIQDAGGVTYVLNSLQAFGNDGNHYNDSINRPPNNAVSQTVANALHNASDHLPVIATFSFAAAGANVPDLGVSAFIQPASACPGNKSLQVRLRNYGTTVFQFSSSPIQVRLRATSPAGQITLFSSTLSSGTLNPGAETNVSFSPDYNMDSGGTYQFVAWSETSGDGNTGNDTLPQNTFSISGGSQVSINPAGPVQLCNGNSITLTAAGGLSYQWSDGSTASSITVSGAGNYSVTATLNGGCTATAGPVSVSLAGSNSTVLFTENMGNVSGTTSIATHENNNGFANVQYTMSGSGDVRNTLPSSGYSGTSGGANIFLTNIAGRNFQISGINSSAYTNLSLSFGIYKNTTASTGADFAVQVSTDGTNYQNLSFSALPTGAGWYLRSTTGTIPSASNLRIRFQNEGTSTQYRIDDVRLSGTPAATITPSSGNSTACATSPLILTASPGNTYLWNTGASTQSISVNGPGTYQVFVDCSPSTIFTVSECPPAPFTLTLFIEGYFTGNQFMRPALFESGLSTNPDACDTVTVTLYESGPPYDPEMEVRALLLRNGNVNIGIPPAMTGQSFFVGIRHRNSLETWSKVPVLIPITGASYNFRN